MCVASSAKNTAKTMENVDSDAACRKDKAAKEETCVMMPEYFEFYNPVKIMCGEAALENIPYELTRLGAHKIFVLISRTMLNDGILERIGGLGKALIETDIPKDSSFAVVKKLAQKALAAECDGVLAVGGGSVLDTAKVVRALISRRKTNPRDLLGNEWVQKSSRIIERIPFIMVPTTSGTGSECTSVAVVQDEQTHIKHEIISDQFLPDAAVLDPRCTEKLPPRLTASCGMDALCHAIEAYTGLQKNPLSDAYAVSAVKLIGKNLIAAVREPQSEEYRMSMACASTMAGASFSNSMVGLCHAIAHAMGAVCGVLHGEAVGMLLPKVMRWQLDAVKEEYGELLCAFCGAEYYAEIPYRQRGEKLIEAIEDTLNHLHQKCGIPVSFKDAGIGRKDLRQILAVTINDGASLTNPKPAGREDIWNILQSAL